MNSKGLIGLLFAVLLMGCNGHKPPFFFGIKNEDMQLTEEQVKAKKGIEQIDISHMLPLCNRYAFTIKSLDDESQSWNFTKNTHQLVHYNASLKLNQQQLTDELTKIRAAYGQETFRDEGESEWYAHANAKIKAAGILAIKVKFFGGYNLVSYTVAFQDEDEVCIP